MFADTTFCCVLKIKYICVSSFPVHVSHEIYSDDAKHRKSPQKVDENDEKISDARKNFRREKKFQTREKAQYFNGTNTAP